MTEINSLEKVMFRHEKDVTFACTGIKANGEKVPLSQPECYAFINLPNAKCLGMDQKGYVIYGKCH
jgi:hypothetical protein